MAGSIKRAMLDVRAEEKRCLFLCGPEGDSGMTDTAQTLNTLI